MLKALRALLVRAVGPTYDRAEGPVDGCLTMYDTHSLNTDSHHDADYTKYDDPDCVYAALL